MHLSLLVAWLRLTPIADAIFCFRFPSTGAVQLCKQLCNRSCCAKLFSGNRLNCAESHSGIHQLGPERKDDTLDSAFWSSICIILKPGTTWYRMQLSYANLPARYNWHNCSTINGWSWRRKRWCLTLIRRGSFWLKRLAAALSRALSRALSTAQWAEMEKGGDTGDISLLFF